MAADQDQEWLIKCLTATLDPAHDIRHFAEVSLNQASLQPGFGISLCKVAANRELPAGLRQLAAVLLKHYIHKHWQEGTESFEPPLVARQEKAMIHATLLATLDGSHRKICTAISMAIASIASFDWPEDWPDLLPFLLNLINDQNNSHGVHGALKCLALLSGDLDDSIVPSLIPHLFPSLLRIVSSSEIYDKYLRTKALSIVYSCTYILGAMSGLYKEETNALLSPMIKQWIFQFCKVLEEPVPFNEPDDWSMRIEILKCVNQFIQNIEAVSENEIMVVVGSLWKTFVSSLGVYVKLSVQCDDDQFEDMYDSDGEDRSFDSFVIQLFEVMLTIAGTKELKNIMKSNIKELVYYTIGFFQITTHQVDTWSADANQFVADEEDMGYSCRVSGILLLEEVLHSSSHEGILAFLDAVRSRFSESQQNSSMGSLAWWKMREAALFALASLSEQLLERDDVRSTMGELVEQVVTEDIEKSLLDYPFLFARLFMTTAKLSSVIRSDIVQRYIHAATNVISIDMPPPVMVGACRAIIELLPNLNKSILFDVGNLLTSLTGLLHRVSDETLHLVLDTLQVSISKGVNVESSVESIVSPALLNLWVANVSDPFICISIIEVLEAIKNVPGAMHPLVTRVLPQIGSILQEKHHQQVEGLVAASLDLVTMLLKNAPLDVVKAINDVCFDAIIQILIRSDDHSELQNATQSLAMLVVGGNQHILAWTSDPSFVMGRLLNVASRLLDPSMDSSGSFYVGSYVLQLLLYLPTQMAQYLQDLVAALVRRLQSAQITGLRHALLLIFARLVHLSHPNVVNFVEILVKIPVESHDNALVYVMFEWTHYQVDVQGAYQIKVMTSALALLLSAKHPALEKIIVHGHIIKSSGIVTRSKAKTSPDQWTLVPLPEKIMTLLADALIEIQEQATEDDEDNWNESDEENIKDSDDLLLSDAQKNPAAYLDTLAKTFNEDEDDDVDDELLCRSDPLNKLDLGAFLAEFFRNFSLSDRQLFDHLCQRLNSEQIQAVHSVIS